MKVVWVTRSFLDYRMPVYAELAALDGIELKLFYCAEAVPPRTQRKATNALGNQSVGLEGEWRLGRKVVVDKMANRSFRIPYQPGLSRMILAEKPDVLIGDGFFQWSIPLVFLRALHRIPLVICYERTAHTERNAQWYRRLYRRLVRRYVDALCCSGRLCGDYCRQLGFDPQRMTYGHMVADTQGLKRAVASLTGNGTAMLRSRLELNRTAFLCVGRLVEQKGVRQLVGAWQALDPALKAEATLLFVGDGPEAGWLKEQVQETSSSIRYAGPVDYDQLHRYYAAADAFVIPTLEDNWSLVVPEAMACGLPILCSKYNGCWPELVHQSGNGWVFDPLDQSDMVRCLAECAKHREQLKPMGVESRVIVSQHTPTHAAESVFRACRIAWERVRGDEEVCANGSSDGRRSTA